jgi:hypothetical protein
VEKPELPLLSDGFRRPSGRAAGGVIRGLIAYFTNGIGLRFRKRCQPT